MADKNTAKLPDLAARRQAATDFRTNLVVEAGAGTGKTSLLVERVLNAIGSGEAKMSQVAAITFTEKAAGEMRERLALGLDRLRALARDEVEADLGQEADRAYAYLRDELDVPLPDLSRRALDAMEELDGGTVVTIHGFCSELLRSHPIEAGVDPDFGVDNGEQADSSAHAAWEEFLTAELGPEARRAELWQALLADLELGAVGEVALRLAGFHVPESLLDADSGVTPAERLLSVAVREGIEEIDDLLSRQKGMTPATLNFFDVMKRALELFLAQGLDALQQRIDSDAAWADRVDKSLPGPNKKLEGVTGEEMKRVASAARRLVRALRSIDHERLRRLMEAIAPFARRFRELFLRQGFVSFDGLLSLTRDLLRDHPEVRRGLKRRFRMLLVDEFQDTDPLQYEIVLFLAEAPEGEAEDAYEAGLEPGRLFIVGDPKQSIYRFRGADYGAYRRAVDRVVEAGGRKLDLVGNFRGVPSVLRPVNRLFEHEAGCWENSSRQPSYVPIAPVRDQADDGPRVELWTIAPEDEDRVSAAERREQEGRLIAREIHDLVVERKQCRFQEVTILFRAFTNVAHYLRPLREWGIPFVVDGGRDFLKRPEVGQLIATLRTLAQPSDPPALLAYLRSPAGGIPDTELAAYGMSRHSWDWRSEPDPQRFSRIAACFERLREISREIRHLPADRAIRRVMESTLLLPLGAAAFEGPQRVANLRKLAAAAGDLARDGKLSLEQVVEALEQGKLEDIETDRPLADDAAEAVRITSIHRMKGLENDRIFLPDLARQETGGRPVNAIAQPTPAGDGTEVLALKASGAPNAACVRMEMEDRLHGLAEEVRVLYVALTRARERTVVLAGQSRGRAPWIEALAPWGYDPENPPGDGETLIGDVLHRIPERAPVSRHVPEGREESARRAAEAYDEAVQALRQRATQPLASPSGLEEETDSARARDAAGLRTSGSSRDLGKAVGNALHRLLETWDGEDPGALKTGLTRVASELTADTDLDETEVLREAGRILETFLGSPLVERFRGARKLGHEVPMLMRDAEGTTFRGSIDLLYRDSDGGIVVADYKTDHTTDPAELRARYGAQLDVYARAVQQAMNLLLPPRKELWLLRTGETIDIP